MRGFLSALALGILAITAFPDSSRAQMGASSKAKAPDTQYEVLSPWAEVDPTPVRGISQRLDTLAGKKIGLFANFKRAAKPIAGSVEKRLKAMYPDIQTSLFVSPLPNVNEIETKNRDNFAAWVKGVDAVILVVGD